MRERLIRILPFLTGIPRQHLTQTPKHICTKAARLRKLGPEPCCFCAISSYPARIRTPAFFRGKTKVFSKSGVKSGAWLAEPRICRRRIGCAFRTFRIPVLKAFILGERGRIFVQGKQNPIIPSELGPVVQAWPSLPSKIKEAIHLMASTITR